MKKSKNEKSAVEKSYIVMWGEKHEIGPHAVPSSPGVPMDILFKRLQELSKKDIFPMVDIR